MNKLVNIFNGDKIPFDMFFFGWEKNRIGDLNGSRA